MTTPTQRRQRAFLAAFPITCSVKRAAQAARVHRAQHYRWLQNPEYREAWQAVQEEVAQDLQDEAVRRAMGIPRLVYYKGKAVRTGRGRSARFVYRVEYSDRLLIELLKIFRPDKYGEIKTQDDAAGAAGLAARLVAARRRLRAAADQDPGAAVA